VEGERVRGEEEEEVEGGEKCTLWAPGEEEEGEEEEEVPASGTSHHGRLEVEEDRWAPICHRGRRRERARYHPYE
jgi:hypothetical protein